MSARKKLFFVLGILMFAACAERGDQVHRTWVGPERADMAVVTLHLGPDVRDLTIRDRQLPRSQYGTIRLAPGKYTLQEQDEASIGFTIRPLIIDVDRARAKGELILGHTYILHAGESKQSGDRALWIEDARTGGIFIDKR